MWKWELNDKGKWTKVPYQPVNPQWGAATDKSSTWGDYGTAIAAYRGNRNGVEGIGFALDSCRDAATGKLTEWAQQHVNEAQKLGAYVEVTVSGTGLRVVGTEVQRKFSEVDGDSGIEVYRACERYITISGKELGACNKLPNIDALIDQTIKFHDEHKAKASKANGHASADKLTEAQYQELLELALLMDNRSSIPVPIVIVWYGIWRRKAKRARTSSRYCASIPMAWRRSS